MYWTRSLLLALLTSACCLSAVSVWKVLDPESVRRDHLKDGGSEKSSPSLRWKSEGTPQFVVVEPSLGQTSQRESNKQPPETDQHESNKQSPETDQHESNKQSPETDQRESNKQLSETDQRESNKQSPEKDQHESNKQSSETDQHESNIQPTETNQLEANKQTKETHYTVNIDRALFGTNVGSSGIAPTGTPTNAKFKKKSRSSDTRYPTEYIDNNGGVRNGASNKDSPQRLDTERGASSGESDQRLGPERGASSEKSNQRLSMESGTSSEESDQRLDIERELRDASFSVSQLKVGISESSDDTFPCPPCTCSYTRKRFVAVNCSSMRLKKFPLNLLSKTISIDLSFNRLRTLNTSSFLHYRFLENVTMISNTRLSEIVNGCLGKQRSNVKVLNMTFCNITTIQDASFGVTPELTDLTIRHNMLRNLTTSTFKGLVKLLHLDLSVNQIAFLEVGTFDDLTEMLSLDLSGNGQLGYSEKRFPPLLFQNLKKLQKLSINDNSDRQSKSYPSRTLQDLAELMELSVDGLANPAEFAPEMKALDKLASLEIRGQCEIKNITENFFQNIPNLTSFLMVKCLHFVHVHPKAYTKLARLQTLSISDVNNYKLKTAFEDLTGLINSPLSSITFRRLQRPAYPYPVLDHEFSQYLQNFSLVYLDLSWNSIYLLGTDFLMELPTTLYIFILKGNKFTPQTMSINHLSVLNGLIELDLSVQNVENFYNQSDLSLENTWRVSKPARQLSSINEDFSSPSESGRLDDFKLDGSHNFESEKGLTITDLIEPRETHQFKGTVTLPPNLRILKASKYHQFGMQLLKVLSPINNSLCVIDFSNSFLTIWGSRILPRGITFANLGNNYCKNINRKFFQAHNSHLQLLLNNNFLGPDFASDTKGEIFSTLSKTVYLDISANLIYSISKPFFSGLSRLKYLLMSDNKLSMLNASFGHIKTLEFIDCSKNLINWIDAETRNDLDAIASSPGHDLTIDLTLNPIPCTCDGLELISWMAKTKVHFHKEHQLTCYPDNKVVEPMGDLEKRRQQLQRLCMSKSVFIIGCSAALTVVMVIVMLGFMYRYRWRLRYLHNTATAAVFGFKPEVSPQSGCTFDAYFVYATDTRDFVLDKCLKELEVNRGHRLCVEDRDFWPGTYIVSSIVSAVRNSTKTVVVLTPDFKEEPYCEYSFKMAVMEELYKQRTVLHLLLYEPVASDQMSHDELSLMRRNSYIEYPPDGGADEGVKRAFWDELSEVIGHSGNDTAEPVLDME